jgi:dTDP-4-dehydrorhamnose 3,5-epimerase
MSIVVSATAISDVLIIEPRVFRDDRGWFFESFNEKYFSEIIGEKINFVQDNHSLSKRGVLRGLHYQMEQTQGKLIQVCHGAVFDVAVDLRKSSSTFGHWAGDILCAQDKKLRWIPPGFAHGFLVMSESAEVLYKTTNYWHVASEKCIIWNDPTINIQWPNIGMLPVLSPKDAAGLKFEKSLFFL